MPSALLAIPTMWFQIFCVFVRFTGLHCQAEPGPMQGWFADVLSYLPARIDVLSASVFMQDFWLPWRTLVCSSCAGYVRVLIGYSTRFHA